MPRSAGVFDLALLGRVDLRDPNGAECLHVLRRPKLVALLAYLAAARPHGLHRRDRVVAVFWPDLDQQHARGALRQAVHHLRNTLGPEVLRTRGDEDLGLDPSRIRCDVAAFSELLAADSIEEALALASGEFLPGFFLPDAPDFERWVEEERAHLRGQVARGATTLVRREAERGNLPAACHWARRMVEAAPYDEEGMRLLMTVLDQGGDRAGAMNAYRRFARLLMEDLGVDPAPETLALADSIRGRLDPSPVAIEIRRGITEAGSVQAGIPHSGRSPEMPEPSPARHRRMSSLALGTALGGIALWAWSFFFYGAGRPPSGDGLASVAVMPFSDYSDGLHQGYLAEGVTEELIGELGRIPELRVISRTSVARFRNTRLGVAAIADTLGVDHLVEGSVVRDGDRLRLRVQLIRAKPETHLWTDAYEGNAGEALRLHREVARAVARALGVPDTALPPNGLSPPPGVDPALFDLYLRGLHSVGVLELEEASRQFQAAAQMDSTFAPAHAALARVYLGEHAFGSLPWEQAFIEGRTAAERALALDPFSVEAHVALGRVHALNWEWPDAEREFRRAVEINPSHTEAQVQYASYLCMMGRFDDAVRHAREARRVDPLSPEANRHLGEILLWAGHVEEAIEQLELMGELGFPAYEELAYAYLAAGRTAEGLEAMRAHEEAFFPDPDRSEDLAMAYAVAGDTARARRILENLARDSVPMDALSLALIWSHLGDSDRAMQYLDEAYQDHNQWLWLIGHPLFAPLRPDPRYQGLVLRMGLPLPESGEAGPR